MNIIIAGDGEVGFHLAKLLSKENHNITIIDPHYDFIKLIEGETDILAVSGDPTSINVLKDNNISNTNLFVSVVHDEKTNIITASLAKQLGAKETIARITNTEYLDSKNQEYFKNMGIDHIVCPERIAADEILSLLSETGAIEIFNFSQGKICLILIKIDENSPLLNKTIDTIANENKDIPFRFVAIHRKSQTIIPGGNDILMQGDLTYVITKTDFIQNVMQVAKIKKYSINNLMIVGASRIGIKTALGIEKKINVKLIEIDKNKCLTLGNILDDTLIINGDARNSTLLEEEDISQMDAFVAVTGNSETNILTCLLAKKYGVKRIIALIDNLEFIDIAQNIDLDIIINKKLITASYIARYTMSTEVASMKCLHSVDAEVMEFVAKPKSAVTKKSIKNLHIPQNAIIGGIIRDKVGYIATGEFQIQENDNVVVFALPSAYKKVQELFH